MSIQHKISQRPIIYQNEREFAKFLFDSRNKTSRLIMNSVLIIACYRVYS